MALIIEQQFPFGRFHATRWNQGAFGDAYGEWPPSPWRLLRAIVARWFQYARETGETKNTEKEKREVLLKPLLQALADSLPAFCLPSMTWRGQALKQYQPTNLDWTDKSKAAAAYRKPQTTLVEDHYRAVPPDELVFWCWESLDDLKEPQKHLLDRLLERTLYFGRAESFSLLRRAEALPEGISINCRLYERDSGEMKPVLVPLPNHPLDFAALLAATDGKELKGRSIPPGTAWYYAQLPEPPRVFSSPAYQIDHSNKWNCIQFSLGGRVYPPRDRWAALEERFRNRVFNKQPSLTKRWPVCFWLSSDEKELPTRLTVWKPVPFTEEEVRAMLEATEKLIFWSEGVPDWSLRIIPLPFETSLPDSLREVISSLTNAASSMEKGSSINIARYAVNSKELPSIQQALPFAEQVRRALIRARTGTSHSEAITGKTSDGSPLEGHLHAHYFATDEDRDGRIDHITIYAPGGFDSDDVSALGQLTCIFRSGNRPDARMILTGMGASERFPDAPLFRESKRWRSVTPFSLPRFSNRGGGKPPRPRDMPEAQLSRELESRRLPAPLSVKRIEGYTAGERPLVRWLEFHSRRFNGSEGHGLAGFEIEFPEVVRGPISLGFACHFGLGLFMPL